MTLRQERFFNACRGLPVDATPVWFPGQVGPHLPEYRALIDRHSLKDRSLIDLYRTPELAAELTALPVTRLGVDAAVAFSHPSLILEPLGISFQLHDDGSTAVSEPVTTVAQVEKLHTVDSEDALKSSPGASSLEISASTTETSSSTTSSPQTALASVLESIRIAAGQLDAPVIGTAGAPFAIASLLVEGGSDRGFSRTRQLMLSDEGLWHALMERVTTATIASLRAQAKAGAAALYLLDDAAGSLNAQAYERYVQPHMQRLYVALTDLDVPIIHAVPNAGHLLAKVRETGVHVVGVDWRIAIDDAWNAIGFDKSIQGNLDPTLLLGPWELVQEEATAVLDRAAAMQQAGYVFSTGGALLSETPVDHLKRLVDLVHEHTPGKKPSRPRTLPARFPNPLPKPDPADGVLLMAYGSPTSLAEMGAYYTHVRGGRPPKPEMVADLVEKYQIIGGMSPLTPTTLSVAHKLESRLGVPVYVGMRHSEPFIADTLQEMAADGIQRAVAITLAPHYSKMSIGAYIKAAEAGLDEVRKSGRNLDLVYLESWSTHPFFIEAIARRIQDAIRLMTTGSTAGTVGAPGAVGAVGAAGTAAPGAPASGSPAPGAPGSGASASEAPAPADAVRLPHDVYVVFTAHSLPESIRKWNDPYEQDLQESCRRIAEFMGLERWELAYQSEGNTPDPWLGPDIVDVIGRLADEGVRSLVICPFGFVADHLEIYYDIDIEAETAARQAGIRLVRTESFNADQEFVELLARLVKESGAIGV